MRTSNPALSDRAFQNVPRAFAQSESMSVDGTITKTGVLFFLMLLSAGYVWNLFFQSGNPATVSSWMMGGVFGGLIIALVTAFKQEWAPFTAPAYALCEGLFIGGISAVLEASYPGIAVQATALTFGVMALMLVLYKTQLIVVTDKLRMGIFAATGAVALLYIGSMILSFFGVQVPFIYGSGVLGIGFSLIVVGIASFNLILDFDFIEQASRRNMPKYMEWYGAFALMVTLVWLYIEILRLLSKMRER
ncbi:MAG: Bax inhibitor-1/YccA family protein [Chlamydiia bacterium]|nr:Bax inhibitor-1/YccA family protein [Chlamydiia bacterium]